MAITITAKHDLIRANAMVRVATRQLPFATSRALNDVAFEVKDSLGKASNQVFDRPTTFIKNAWRVQKATKQDLVALVFPEAKREPYLRANITGGQRGVKKIEAAFKGVATQKPPADKFFPTSLQKKDSKGNVSRGTLRKILQSLQSEESGRNTYFIGQPRGKQDVRPYGIYRRMARKIKPVFLPATQTMKYDAIFDIKGIGQKVVERRFSRYLDQRFNQALRTAR